MEFYAADYREYNPVGYLVYCDPPYINTTAAGGLKGLDHEVFWDTMRAWSERSTVLISEYVAPQDFESVAEFQTKTDMRRADGKKDPRVERIFKMKQ